MHTEQLTFYLVGHLSSHDGGEDSEDRQERGWGEIHLHSRKGSPATSTAVLSRQRVTTRWQLLFLSWTAKGVLAVS